MFLSYDARIENARIAGQRIHGRVDAAFHNLPAQVRGRIQVCECRGGRRVRIIIRRHINRLHRGNRTGLRRSDAFLKLADFCIQVRLITHRRRHAPEQRGDFRSRLHEAENVIDEKQHIEMLLIAEVLRHGEPRQTHTQPSSRGFCHLPIDERGARLFRIARHDHAGFLEFQPQVVSLTRALADSRENGHASVLHGHVVNQLLNQNRFADAGTAEQANFPALQEGLNEVHDLDACLKHLQRCGLLVQQGSRPVNLIHGRTRQRAQLIHRLSKNVHHPPQRGSAHRNTDALAEIVSFHPAHQAFRGLHRYGAHAPFPEVLLHLRGHINRFGNVVPFAGDAHRVVNRGKVSRFELHVKHRPDYLHDVSHRGVFLCHAFS